MASTLRVELLHGQRKLKTEANRIGPQTKSACIKDALLALGAKALKGVSHSYISENVEGLTS